MQPFSSYDEMIDERISADLEARILCEWLRATVVGAWSRWQSRPRRDRRAYRAR